MSSIFRPSPALLASFGTGFLIGVGGSGLYFKLTSMIKVVDELEKLTLAIADLKSEVQELRDKIPTRKRRIPSGYISTATSSGETDDEAYEDALGSSDFENLHDSQTELHTQINSGALPQGLQAGDNIVDIYLKVDQLLDGGDEDKYEASDLLNKNKDQFLLDAEFYWRLSKTTYQISQIEGAKGNKDKQKELVYSAKDAASKAISLNEKCANAHKWYAITLGSSGDFEGTQEKIKNGYVFKEHIERAIDLSPSDPSNHHLLGRWCFGVYMLSWLERKAAAALYATPPSSTAEEALQNFMEAERLRPGKWKENMLFIAKIKIWRNPIKGHVWVNSDFSQSVDWLQIPRNEINIPSVHDLQCHIQLAQYKQAVEWLDKGNNIPVVSQDDKESQKEIQSLLQKYGAYRE